MNNVKFEQKDFKKSSASFMKPHCVQVAFKESVIAVGDTKNTALEPLRFNIMEWKAFIQGVKNGEFDYFD